jgi:hypothetical protein
MSVFFFSLSFSFIIVVHLSFRLCLRLGFSFLIAQCIFVQKRSDRTKENVIRLLVPPADVNFACTRHSLSCCLHAKGSWYNKGPNCHPSSARGCIAVQKSPMPCITRIGAVSRCWYLFLILLSFADVSRDILRFVLRRSSSE